MSNLAHVPWAVGILAAAVALHFFGAPITAIGWVGAFLFCFTREETQREYQIIETLNPPLRAGLNIADAFKFWRWNKHSKLETVLALGAAAVAAIAAHVLTGL